MVDWLVGFTIDRDERFTFARWFGEDTNDNRRTASQWWALEGRGPTRVIVTMRSVTTLGTLIRSNTPPRKVIT